MRVYAAADSAITSISCHDSYRPPSRFRESFRIFHQLYENTSSARLYTAAARTHADRKFCRSAFSRPSHTPTVIMIYIINISPNCNNNDRRWTLLVFSISPGMIRVIIIIHHRRALRCWVRLFFPRLATSQINLPCDVVKNCYLANTKLNCYITF